jgi:hypothetical protein
VVRGLLDQFNKKNGQIKKNEQSPYWDFR